MNVKTVALLALTGVFLALTACHAMVKPNVTELASEAELETDPADDVSSGATKIPPIPEPTPTAPLPEAAPTAELKTDLLADSLPIEFRSATDQYNLRHPAGWVIEEDEKGLGLVMANSEAALTRFKTGQVEPDDFVLNIAFIPDLWFEGQGIELGTTPDVFLQSIMPLLRPSGDDADSPAVSDSELVPLSDEVEAGLLAVSDDEREGRLIVFEATDGVFIFITASGYPGEVKDFQEMALAIAANMEYTGSSKELGDAFFSSEN